MRLLIPTRAAAVIGLCLAATGVAVAGPASELTRPVNATARAKQIINGQTTAARPGIVAVRVVTALRDSVAGQGEPNDPTVTWRWRERPRPGATQAVAVVTVLGFADDSVRGERWTLVLRRCDGWHLVGALRQRICQRGATPDRRLCL